jgi:NAD(P) transhydrogenase subunit beta
MVIDGIIIMLLIAGIGLFRTPPGARRGTMLAALAMAAAIAVVLVRIDINRVGLIAAALFLGAFAGLWVAVRVNMIQIPAMIAFQHGAGGMAAFLVCFVELWRGADAGMGALQTVAGLAGLVVGAGTFSASLVAGGKLANILPSRPFTARGHSGASLVVMSATVVAAVMAGLSSGASLVMLLAVAILLKVCLGGSCPSAGGAPTCPCLSPPLTPRPVSRRPSAASSSRATCSWLPEPPWLHRAAFSLTSCAKR